MLDAVLKLLRGVLRLVFALIGFALAAVLVVSGLVIAVGVVVWARLRGRPLALRRFQVRRGAAGASPVASPPAGDVIDIEAGVVPEPGAGPVRRLPTD